MTKRALTDKLTPFYYLLLTTLVMRFIIHDKYYTENGYLIAS